MKIVFLAGALGHFHNEMCKGLYKYYGNDFKFIQTQQIDESRRKIGVLFENLPYVITEKNGLSENVRQLILDCDVLIYGAAKYSYIKERINQNKIVLYYSERLFKKGIYSLLNPRTLWDVVNRFIIPGCRSNTHLICASAYASYDFARLHVFNNRMYKWGYYPRTTELQLGELFEKKRNRSVELLWVGRLVELKHADDAIAVMARLKAEQIQAHLTIIGTGTDEKKLQEFVRAHNLIEEISFLGAVSIDMTREKMEQADIFLFTSDFREGWGATLNEAMNSACAVVASHAAGATPFLVDHAENGYVYKSGDVDSLYYYVKKLVLDKSLRHKLGQKANETIVDLWNIENASSRLITLIDDLYKHGTSNSFNNGPCSKAEIIKPDWVSKCKDYE